MAFPLVPLVIGWVSAMGTNLVLRRHCFVPQRRKSPLQCGLVGGFAVFPTEHGFGCRVVFGDGVQFMIGSLLIFREILRGFCHPYYARRQICTNKYVIDC